MKNIYKRLLSIVLAITIVLTLLPNLNVSAANKFDGGVTKEFRSQKSGDDYLCKIQVSEDKMSFQLDMTNTDTNKMTTVIFEQGVATTYETTSKNVLGVEVPYKKQVNKVVYTEAINSAENSFSPMAYRSKVMSTIPTLAGNFLWYQMGISSPDIGYMKIGCVKTYRLKADITSDCATFRNKIIECNNLCAAAGVSSSSAIIMGIAILTAGFTGGLSIVAAFGLTGTAATTFIAACYAEQAAHDAYDIIKGYGIALK